MQRHSSYRSTNAVAGPSCFTEAYIVKPTAVEGTTLRQPRLSPANSALRPSCCAIMRSPCQVDRETGGCWAAAATPAGYPPQVAAAHFAPGKHTTHGK